MKFIIGLLLGLFLAFNISVFGDKISAPPPLSKEYKDVSEVLYHYLREIFDNYHVLEVTTTAPDGNRKGRIGSMIIYNNSGTYELWINDDGDTSWQKI